MTLIITRAFALLLVILITLPSQSAHAITSGIYACPVNCEQSRKLFLCSPPLRGDDVRGLQEMLFSLDLYKQPLNGVFDIQTEKAVCNFQEKYGLEVTGIVTDNEWTALTQVLEKPVTQNNTPPPEGEKVILIDTINRTLTLFNNGEQCLQFPVAVGKHETPTPIGNWKVARKAANWGTGFGTRWLGLNVSWGIYGIHGTNKPYSIGGYQSHGCIRMHNSDVEQLYNWVPEGTPVIIAGNPFSYMKLPYKMMRKGERGATVMEVQSALKRLGYNIEVDGIWGEEMEKVVIQYRKDIGLPFDNAVDNAVYKSLGFKD